MTTRHEFLAQLHELLKPATYLEVGVQLGTSLRLAHAAELAIGIDPQPLTAAQGNERIYSVTADDFFKTTAGVNTALGGDLIDLAFIDGSHLFEDALCDFVNIEEYAHSGTVVVFDDVLPYSAAIAGRQIIAGDWTGDVWKVAPILGMMRPDLNFALVDTSPTGSLVAWGFDSEHAPAHRNELTIQMAGLVASWMDQAVPQFVIDRAGVDYPGDVLDRLSDWHSA